MAPYNANFERRKIAIKQCKLALKSASDAPAVLAQLGERERESTCLEERVEILGEITILLINAKCYKDALQSSMKIEQLGSSAEYAVGKLTSAVLFFTTWTARWISQQPNERDSEQDDGLVTRYFKQAFHLCLEVVGMESFCDFDRSMIELFVSAALRFTVYNHVLISLQEFKECLIWFISRFEKWESAMDFIQRKLPKCQKAELFFRLGRLFIQAGEDKTLNFAADLLQVSGQLLSIDLKFELATMSYSQAVHAAIFSKDLNKAELILIEALETIQLRKGEWVLESSSQPQNEARSKSLWEPLFFLAGNYETKKKLLEAANLLKKGLAVARLVQNEERRKYLVVKIELKLGQLSSNSSCKLDVDYLRAALEDLGDAPNTMPGDPSLVEWTQSMLRVRMNLGCRAFLQKLYQEAYEEFELHSQFCTDPKLESKSKALAAIARFYMGARKEGLKALEEAVAVMKNDSDLQCDRAFLAEILFLYSPLLKENGDIVKSFEITEEAIIILCKPHFLEREFLRLGAPEILKKHFWLGKDLSGSVDFIQLIDPAISSSREASNRSDWHRLMARFYLQMQDKEEAQSRMESFLVSRLQPEVHEDGDIDGSMNALQGSITLMEIEESKGIEPTVKERFETLIDIAETCTDQKEQQNQLKEAKALAQKEWGNVAIVGYVSLMLAYIYEKREMFQLAEEETESAMKLFEAVLEENHPLRSRFLGQSYMRKASIAAKKACATGQVELVYEAQDWLTRARPLMEGRAWWQQMNTSHKVAQNMLENQSNMVEDSVLQLLDMHLTEELRFQPTMGSLWIESLEKSMALYRTMEFAANKKPGNNSEGLVWSERGRTRWFMSIAAKQAGTSHMPKLTDFDKNVERAKDMFKSIVEECGSNVAIIEYSYIEYDGSLSGLLYIYVIYLKQGELKIHSILVDLLEDLKSKWNKNLEAFVALVRRAIDCKTEEGDKQAKEYLAYLHDILRFRFIMDHLLPPGCNTLVFAPSRDLSLLPLHALYDNFRGEYLIQQIRVCYTPSLRLLGHCFELQQMHKASRSSRSLERAFVAGNPHPMGCGKGELPGAEQEAIDVAEILGVQPCVREQMTKEAVVQGLCGSSIVLLATHALYPPGAIVLRTIDHQNDATEDNDLVDDITEDEDLADNITEDDDILEDITEDDTIHEEMISADEISKLHISAALVVLDGCETGLGKVKSEGVIGLGRSVLQAGASTVVLSLWRVQDLTTRTLVTGMFRNALDGQRSVVESLRTSMLNMLQDSSMLIYHWAPLIVVGSSTLCINDLISNTEEIVDTVNSNSSTSSMSLQSTMNKEDLDEVKEAQISSQTFNSNVKDCSSFLGLPQPVVHAGVCCDGCNTTPITGLRFQARASFKDNYDLCSECFTSKGCTLDQYVCIVWPKLAMTLVDKVRCSRESCIRGGQCRCIKKKIYMDGSKLSQNMAETYSLKRWRACLGLDF